MKRSSHLAALLAILVFVFSCNHQDSLEEFSAANNSTLSIIATDEDGDLIAAEGMLVSGDQLISQFDLASGVTKLPVSFSEGVLKVIVQKEGYESSVIEIDPQSVSASNNRPLHVKMKSALAMTVRTSAEDDLFLVELEGIGSITVVWPDGSTDVAAMPLSVSKEFDEGSRTVVLKGDLAGIKTFRSFGYNATITSLTSLKGMTNLQVFFPGNLSLQEQLDLSHNRNLISIDLFNATLPNWLKLPEHHFINSFTASLSDRNITATELDMLISNLYKNAVKRNITGGTIALTGSDQVRPQTMKQIAVLENKYGWVVDTNL